MKLKALVISHHKRFRRDLAKLVELMDSCVEVVGEGATARDAISSVDQFEPDLVFIDLGLRHGDSLVLIERIRVRHPEASVIVVGNEPSNDYRCIALEAGALEYVDVLEISTQLPEALMQVSRSDVCVEREPGIVEPATSAIPPTAVPTNFRSRLRTAPTGPKHGPFTAWQYVHIAVAVMLVITAINLQFGPGLETDRSPVLMAGIFCICVIEWRQFNRARRTAIRSQHREWRGGAVAN